MLPPLAMPPPWPGGGTPYPSPSPLPNPARSKKGIPPWVWILVGLGALSLLAVGGLVVLGLNQALTHDLLKADFEKTAEPFHIGTQAGVEYGLVDGAYSIRQTESGSHVSVSFGEFRRPAYVVDLRSDVVAVAGQPLPTSVGLGCYNRKDPPDGYVLLAAPDGSKAAIGRRAAGGRDVTVLATYTAPTGTAQPVTLLELRCAIDSPLGSGMHMTGSINGNVVVTASDSIGIGEFTGAALVMVADQLGAETRFDNVTATVPGE